VAALIKAQLQLESTVVEGKRGEFSVWVGDRKVAQKDMNGFPDDQAVVEAVRAATAGG